MPKWLLAKIHMNHGRSIYLSPTNSSQPSSRCNASMFWRKRIEKSPRQRAFHNRITEVVLIVMLVIGKICVNKVQWFTCQYRFKLFQMCPNDLVKRHCHWYLNLFKRLCVFWVCFKLIIEFGGLKRICLVIPLRGIVNWNILTNSFQLHGFTTGRIFHFE